MLKKEVTYYTELALSAILFSILDYAFPGCFFSMIGLGFVTVGLVLPGLRYVNYYFWDFINKVTSTIGEFVLLFLVYFLIVTPIGFLFKLRNRKKNNVTSTLVDCEDVFSLENLKKTW